jgi:hypothetical protein
MGTVESNNLKKLIQHFVILKGNKIKVTLIHTLSNIFTKNAIVVGKSSIK